MWLCCGNFQIQLLPSSAIDSSVGLVVAAAAIEASSAIDSSVGCAVAAAIDALSAIDSSAELVLLLLQSMLHLQSIRLTGREYRHHGSSSDHHQERPPLLTPSI